MKSFHRSTITAKQRRREVWIARVRRMNAARERKRLAAHAGEPIGTDWRGRWETTVTVHDRITGRMQTFDIYRGHRRDRYDIRRDGQPWRHGVTATWFAAALRKRLACHVSP